GPNAMRPAWEWQNAPFIASLRYPHAPLELFTPVSGNFEGFQIGNRNVDVVTAGDELTAVGWTLAGHATPLQVAISMDGGRQTIATGSFFDRPDIRESLHEASPAGWRIPISTSGLAPGKHTLTAFTRVSEKGEARFLGERALTV